MPPRPAAPVPGAERGTRKIEKNRRPREHWRTVAARKKALELWEKEIIGGGGGDRDPLEALGELTRARQATVMKSLLSKHIQFKTMPGLMQENLDHIDDCANGARFAGQVRADFIAANTTNHNGEDRWPPNVHDTPNLTAGMFKPCDAPATNLNIDDEEGTAPGLISLEHNAYCLRKHFTTQWGVLKRWSKSMRTNQNLRLIWHDKHWDHNEDIGELMWCKDGTFPNQKVCLFNFITSRQLLYRLTVTFDAQPTIRKGRVGNSAWGFVLRNEDDADLEFHIVDKGGKPRAFLWGDRSKPDTVSQLSNQALQLMDWLLSTNCPLAPGGLLEHDEPDADGESGSEDEDYDGDDGHDFSGYEDEEEEEREEEEDDDDDDDDDDDSRSQAVEDSADESDVEEDDEADNDGSDGDGDDEDEDEDDGNEDEEDGDVNEDNGNDDERNGGDGDDDDGEDDGGDNDSQDEQEIYEQIFLEESEEEEPPNEDDEDDVDRAEHGAEDDRAGGGDESHHGPPPGAMVCLHTNPDWPGRRRSSRRR